MSSHSYDHDDRSPTAHSDLTTPTANETDGSPSPSFRGGPGPSSLRPSTHRPLASSIAVASPALSPAVKTTSRSILHVHNHDVLSGRGVNIAHHPGNERFRTLVTTYTDKSYCTSYSVVEKKAVADQIIQHIKALDPPGRFLKREGKGAVSRALIGPWEELSQKDAVKKTCQALRDCNRQDRTGYAVAVKAPVDVKHAADRASKAGLSVKERAKAAASKLKKRESDYSLGHGYSRSQSHVYDHAPSSNASKRGKTQQSLGVKRSRDELDNDYYASIYPSMPTSVSTAGVHPAAAATAYSDASEVRPESTHSRQDSSHVSNQSNAPMVNQSSHHGVPSQQSHTASKPSDNFLDYTISAPISASQVAPPAEDPTLQGPTPPAGGYTSHNQHDHGSNPMYHNQEHSQNHYPHDNAHSDHGYPYPQSNPPNYSYGYEQNYGASDQYQHSYDPRGYYGGSSSNAPPYSHYPNYPPNHNQSHNPYSSVNSEHDHNYNHAHNQFRTVDESWALKKQRTDDTDPSLTSTAHSTTGTSASSPLDGSLDIMAPAPPAHTGNVAIHENVNDIFKDDSWTRGPAGDAGTDAGGIGVGVGPNTSMDGGFPDPMDDTLFSFDNEKY